VVVEGLSPLADKIGDELAHPDLTIIDDGVDPTFLNTTAYDAEGTRSQRNPIIEKGVLKNFIFDSYYGNIFGAETTGNCQRSGSTLSYEQTPSIGTDTLDVKPGTKTEQELLEAVEGPAVYIQDMPMGIMHSNVASGEFSIKCTNVYLVKDGEKVTPLEAVTVGGSFYEGLKNLKAISRKIRRTPFGVNAPSVLIEGFSVVG